MTSFIQTIIDALSLGAIYSLLAVALVVVYRGNRTLNFAQGETAMLTSFIAVSVIGVGLPMVLSLITSAIAGFVICVLIYHVLIRPLRGRQEWSLILIGAGLYLGVNALGATIWGTDPREFPSIFPNGVDDFFTLGGARVYYTVIGNLAALVILTAALAYLTNRTSIGLQMRAVASNPDSSELVGVPVNRILQFSWGIAGVIGAIAGILTAPITTLSTQMMVEILLYSLAAATLGGLDSIKGAALGGIAVALLTTILSTYVPWIGQDLKQAAAMVLIVLVLVVRPSGVFGTAAVQRV